MKAHTSEFKENISQIGKQLDSIITYEQNGDTIELGNEELNSVTPNYKGAILKSVMKQLDIDSNVDIPIGTEINYQFGVKVGNTYEYLDFGNYIVNSSEKQEDVNSYKIIAYDKMLYSMKDYESLSITYPITIRNYINALCQHIGLEFANAGSTFANYNRQIAGELYLDSQGNSMGYKFRDVLDELAQATGSTICINDNDQLEIRYITNSNDTIDEEFFKDINVNFGERYGPVNSIVLSRSGGADNVYIQDQQSIAQNGLCEIKISDNQIMNWNDRSDYLPDLLNKLGGLQYYLNDYVSTGIAYYDLCDRYQAHIGDTYYSCVMFNDELLVTQGLEENVYTDRPQQSETDYSKADKTDRKINQTYFLVDKQNQTIQSVITQTTDTSNPNSLASKQSVLTQRVDSLESAISDIADITISGESSYATVDLDNINQSEPIVLNIRPVGTNISYLYPRANLYPSDTLYMTDRRIRFHNNTTNENIYYTLPDDLLWYDNDNYDEFMLDYNSQTCKVTKKCQYNADGTVSLLSSSRIDEYLYPTINLTEGDYTISIYGYNTGYIFTRLMTNNIYTDQFYTKAETDTKISQTASDITLGVNQTLSNYSTTNQMNSAISLSAQEINSSVSENYSTKTETTNAKNEAINSSNSTTDTKLQDYSTTTQMNSAINQKASEITSSVSQTYATKSTTNTLSSRISQTAKSIALQVNNNSTSSGITITTTKEDGTTSQATGTIQMNGLVSFTNLSTSGQTDINGNNITTGIIKSQNYVANTSGTKIDLSNGVIDSKNFKVKSNGGVEMKNGSISNGSLEITDSYNNIIKIGEGTYGVEVGHDNLKTILGNTGISAISSQDRMDVNINGVEFKRNNKLVFDVGTESTGNVPSGQIRVYSNGTQNIKLRGYNGEITCVHVTQTSKEENKKDFEKLQNGLDIVKNTDIYKYHFKQQDSKEKKYIGFVIGDKYKYSKEITSQDNDGVDLYSMVGVCFKAIQEQQEQIENLKKEIEKLKEGK